MNSLAHSQDSPAIFSRTHSISNPVPPIRDAHPSVRPSFYHLLILLPRNLTHVHPPRSSVLRARAPTSSVYHSSRYSRPHEHGSLFISSRRKAPDCLKAFVRSKAYSPLGLFVHLLHPSFSSRFSAIGIDLGTTLIEHFYSELPIVSGLELLPPLCAIFFEPSEALHCHSTSEIWIICDLMRSRKAPYMALKRVIRSHSICFNSRFRVT